jgi:hypothetical protein
VTQAVRQVRGRLTGWTGPLATRRSTRISQRIDTVERGGEAVGVDIRGEASDSPSD